MTLAVLLTGQGAQHPEMFALTATLPAAQPIFETAKPLLAGTDPRDLVGRDSAELHSNRTGQILCCVAALAAWSIVAEAAPARTIVAGYSIGDLAAWGCTGRFAPEAVLRLAAARAEAMDVASGEGFGLAGIRGLALDDVAKRAQRHGCHLAIRNAADSAVVGGPTAALEPLCAEAAAAGAQRAVLLPVHTPSHTPFLAAASERFAEALSKETLLRPSSPAPRLLSGLDGAAVFRPEAGLDKLARQVSETIDWAACLQSCREFGAEAILELGPGHALSTMARDALPEARVHALEDFRKAEGVIGWIREQAGA